MLKHPKPGKCNAHDQNPAGLPATPPPCNTAAVDSPAIQCLIVVMGQVATMKHFWMLGLTLAVAACASKPSDIAPTYVSPVAYQNFTCEQLQAEAEMVSQQAAVASGQQEKHRKNDTVKTTVGVVLFWPVLLFNEGDGQTATELSRLKGQMTAIQQASAQKNCGFTFQQ